MTLDKDAIREHLAKIEANPPEDLVDLAVLINELEEDGINSIARARDLWRNEKLSAGLRLYLQGWSILNNSDISDITGDQRATLRKSLSAISEKIRKKFD